MRELCRLFLIVSASALWSIAGRSQVIQVYPPGAFSIAGFGVSCGSAPTAVVMGLPDIGMTASGVISLNAENFLHLPPQLELFIYAHECGHIVNGSSEPDADCFAAKLGRDQGWFDQQTFEQIVSSLSQSPGGSGHWPGPFRIRHIVDCFNQMP